MRTAHLFDGITGRVAAKVMAGRNREAEHEAVAALDPLPSDTVVAIGVGPGVGVDLLAAQVGRVVAVDPSTVMADETARRTRRAVDAGTVVVARTDAADLPLDAGEADGAIAVNSIQLWEPLGPSLAEVARVLRPGGRLVTLTHDWAIERNTGRSPDAWAEWVGSIAAPVGLVDPKCWRAQAERRRSVALTLTKAITR